MARAVEKKLFHHGHGQTTNQESSVFGVECTSFSNINTCTFHSWTMNHGHICTSFNAHVLICLLQLLSRTHGERGIERTITSENDLDR